jgi:hypothetical protein
LECSVPDAHTAGAQDTSKVVGHIGYFGKHALIAPDEKFISSKFEFADKLSGIPN